MTKKQHRSTSSWKHQAKAGAPDQDQQPGGTGQGRQAGGPGQGQHDRNNRTKTR